MNRILPLLLLSAALAACVPEVEQSGDAKSIDVIRSYLQGNYGFVFTRDLDNTAGAGAILDLDTVSIPEKAIAQGDLSSDVILQSDGENIYLIDRGHGSFITVNPNTPEKKLEQISAGAAGNPYAVVRANGKLYIPRFDDTSLLILDAETHQKVGSVDLSKYASPADPYPEMANAVSAEGKVWVVLQRLDRSGNFWTPSTQPVSGAFVVSIDPATDKIADEVKLLGENPYQLGVDPVTGFLFAVSSVNWAGGIELINPKSARSAGWLLETGLFPNGINYAAVATTAVYVVSGENPDANWDYERTVLWAVDRDDPTAKAQIADSTAGYWGLACLELAPKGLLVACAGPGTRVDAPGLRVFDTRTNKELTTKPLNTGLPPVGVVFFAERLTEVVSRPVTTSTD